MEKSNNSPLWFFFFFYLKSKLNSAAKDTDASHFDIYPETMTLLFLDEASVGTLLVQQPLHWK